MGAYGGRWRIRVASLNLPEKSASFYFNQHKEVISQIIQNESHAQFLLHGPSSSSHWDSYDFSKLTSVSFSPEGRPSLS